METASLNPLLEQLEDNIDDIEEALQPLLEQGLSSTAQKLPLMEKAKLHVLLTYSIESLLFSYLRLNDVDAKEHPVFNELKRVRQYHEKIKTLETPPEKRTMTLDKQAAERFIKHGLAGNDKIDLERAEREAKEKAMAQLRAAQLARMQAKATVPQKRSVEEAEMSERDSAAASTSDPQKSERMDLDEEDGNEEDDEDEDEGEDDGANDQVHAELAMAVKPETTNGAKKSKKMSKKERKEKSARKKEKSRLKRQRKRAANATDNADANAGADG